MTRSTIKEALDSKGSFKVVCLGDSITSAEWVHPNWREIVEYVVKEELSDGDFETSAYWGIKFINSGLDGATTIDWLARLAQDVLNYEPDLVLVMGTSNDLVKKITVAEHVKNIETLLNKLALSVSNVVFCTDIASNSREYDQKYKPYVTALEQVLSQKKIKFINLFEAFRKLDLQRFFTFANPYGIPDVGMKPNDVDFIHPNQLGNAYIAQILLDNVFEIKFDPESYLKEVTAGKMFPDY